MTLGIVAKPEVCINSAPATAAHPCAGEDADGFFPYPRGRENREIGVGVQALDDGVRTLSGT